MPMDQTPDDKSDGSEPEPGYRIDNPEQLARNMFRLLEQGGKVFAELSERPDRQTGPYSALSEIGEAGKILGAVTKQWAKDPARLIEAQGRLAKDYMDLWGRSMRRFLGDEVEPVAKPDPGDSRFKDEDWSNSQFFDFWKQAYLLTSQWADEMVDNTQGLDEKTKKKAEFYLNQLASALSPSNFVLTNPEILRETLASNAENLVRGLGNLSEDIQASGDLLNIKQTDLSAFEVGKNLATTPGKIVYQNDIIQLIQYEPATNEVHEIPLLIVPPWINKFYILDLVPHKSFIKWTVDQGFTVFVISWVNPDEHLAAKTFEDYMQNGVLDAVSAVEKATGAHSVNALGYCVGGTLLAATLAYMAAMGDKHISAATLLTAQTDFSKAGDLLVFIDEDQLDALEEMMAKDGYLDGARMASVFNMLRPRDLIWSYVINNYLMGKQPFPFDLLYWNSDSTRMPAANHSFYLRSFYYENKLAKGEMELFGKHLDLGKVTIPIYELATREDHIAPAESVYIGSKLFGGPVRFVLAGSGHIAGVVNPPEKHKYQHWRMDKTARKDGQPETLEEWIEKATEHTGSWWPNWSKWLAKKSGDMVPARRPGDGELQIVEDAPGSYVKIRSGVHSN